MWLRFEFQLEEYPFSGMRMKVAKIGAKGLLALYELGKRVKKSHNCSLRLFVSVGVSFKPF